MDFGPNYQLVREVIQVFDPWQIHRGVFCGEIPLDPSPFEIVEDRRRACQLAWKQKVIWEGYDEWRAMVEWEGSPLLFPDDPVLEDHNAARRYFEGRRDEFQHALTHLLGAKAKTEILADHTYEDISITIGMDYALIALARLQFGIGYEPFETMFSAYKQGGWPCGWWGKYPDGKMVVYHIGPKI